MSWDLYHTESEKLAGDAEALRARGDDDAAAELYGRAAEAEESALAALDPSKPRTRGITAVSALSLWHKAGRRSDVIRLGTRLLSEALPHFAQVQVREILGSTTQPDGTHQHRFEVEITVRQTLRYAVAAANHAVAEREAVERWRNGEMNVGQVTESCELVEVRSNSAPSGSPGKNYGGAPSGPSSDG